MYEVKSSRKDDGYSDVGNYIFRYKGELARTFTGSDALPWGPLYSSRLLDSKPGCKRVFPPSVAVGTRRYWMKGGSCGPGEYQRQYPASGRPYDDQGTPWNPASQPNSSSHLSARSVEAGWR